MTAVTAAIADLATHRRNRLEQRADPTHPALRWTAGTNTEWAHRRRHDATAWCGAPGTLTIAPTDTDRCPACYGSSPGN
jgi:hypothetical protein